MPPQIVTLELHGLPSQKVGKVVLRVETDRVVVKGYGCPEEVYSLKDGRRLGSDGKPTSWDLWRLSEQDRMRLETK